jgi:hypothetical protein
MDHVVYLDAKEKELDKLRSGQKSMIIRGAAGRKLPHGRFIPARFYGLLKTAAMDWCDAAPR